MLPFEPGAGKRSRTVDLNLGKVALYQLSYSRIEPQIIATLFDFFVLTPTFRPFTEGVALSRA